MPVQIKPKITDAGLQAAINAQANGLQLAITHVALGTGTYDSEASGAGMTNMVGRKEKRLIDAGVVSGTGAFKVAVNFGPWSGTPATYDATELGFWAGDPDAGGTLFAIFSVPDGVIVTRNLLLYVASFVVQLTRVPSGSVMISVNPDADEVIALIALHENATDPHGQYLKKAGDTATGPLRGLTASQHDDSTLFATTAYVHRNGLRFPNVGGLAVTSSPYTLTPAHLGRWVELSVNNGTVNLPAAADCPAGATYSFRVVAPAVNVVPYGSDVIVNAQGDVVSLLQVARGDTLVLVRNSTANWYVVSFGMRMPAGMVSFFVGNVAPAGWLKMNGALLSRAAYPALWTFAQATGGVVSEAEWAAGFSGRYSTGTDGTNFRLPDARGLFLRAFDDGRGVDAGREWGRYQEQDNLAHSHGLTDPGHAHALTDPGHSHGATAALSGTHAHGVDDPGHSHASQYNSTTPNGLDYSNPTGDEIAGWGTGRSFPTSTATTGIGIQAAGSHDHSISVALAGTNIGLAAALTGMSVQSNGSESRPRNLALGIFVKY